MTNEELRDHFAGMAMHAIIMKGYCNNEAQVVRDAYEYADAMLKAKGVREPEEKHNEAATGPLCTECGYPMSLCGCPF